MTTVDPFEDSVPKMLAKSFAQSIAISAGTYAGLGIVLVGAGLIMKRREDKQLAEKKD